MSKTKKVSRLQRKVRNLEKELNFANSEWVQRINRTVPYIVTPPPVFESNSNRWEVDQINTLGEYLYKEMDNAYNMAYKMGETDNLEFVLYIDAYSFRKLLNIAGYYDLQRDSEGKTTFRGHKVVEVLAEKNYIHFSRIK